MMLSSMSAVSVAVLVFVIVGFSSAGFGSAGYALHLAGRGWNVIGTGRLFARSVTFDGSAGPLILVSQMFSVAFAALIPVAGGAERWRLAGVAASTAVLAAIVYPLFAHWASAEGWLGQLGFLDAGGAASIQAVGGITALCIVWLLGSRQNKFTSEGIPTAMPGHNATLVLFGSLLALIGWLGLNLSGAALVDVHLLPLAAINTVLSAAAGALGALVTTRLHFGKPDASLSANGFVAGLVAISASAPYVKPAAAILIGLVVGPLIVFAIELVEVHMHVDDPAGAISVHGFAAIWGLLALSMFADHGSFLAQTLAIATLIGIILPLSYGLNLLLNRFVPYRVEPGGERQGMDLFELGAGAYPEFVTHREDRSPIRH
jgi:ammonium transporter, Amt family